jgi:hypothetical protein
LSPPGLGIFGWNYSLRGIRQKKKSPACDEEKGENGGKMAKHPGMDGRAFSF